MCGREMRVADSGLHAVDVRCALCFANTDVLYALAKMLAPACDSLKRDRRRRRKISEPRAPPFLARRLPERSSLGSLGAMES